jgi:cytochrome c biogenesis protein CcmG, thiol:disulfide interchange protein DsbE
MRWRNVFIVALVTVPLLVILALGFGQDPHAVPSVLPGKPAPMCDLKGLDGKALSLTDFRGKPIVVNFWASWCVPCEAEHQILQQTARTFGDRVQFLGVVYQDEPETARRYLARSGSAYPQLTDPESRCAIDYGVAGVPETFLIDPAGKVFDKVVGPVSPAPLAKALGDMLQGGRP